MLRNAPSPDRLATAVNWGPMVSSWLGARVLADVVPVVRGRVTWTTSQKVPSTLRLSVPRSTVEGGRTVSWRPSSPDAPLARYGQTLDVSILSESVLSRLGRFQIQDWKDTGDVIELTGAGRLQRVLDDRLTTPLAPLDGGTLRSELLRLLPSGMTASFDPSLVDRECPKTMQWDESRIDAIYGIADAWPARLREDDWGNLMVLPPLPELPTPEVTLTDGEGGTVIGAPITDSREDAPNVFVARSSATGVEAQAVVEVQSGPMSTGGEYGRVIKIFSSPLLADESQCRAAAETQKRESMRQNRVRQVTIAPDPRIMLDTAVELVIDKGTPDQVTEWGVVVAVDMPLTVADGEMRLDVATF